MKIVARPSRVPILTTSVAVVRKILDAVAGSAPSFFNVRGTIAFCHSGLRAENSNRGLHHPTYGAFRISHIP
jgi:hypothetical protein